MKQLKNVMFLLLLTALLLWAGQTLAGHGGLMVALMVTGLMNTGAYWWSDQRVLRMQGAQSISEMQTLDLWTLGRTLVARANSSVPRVYMTPAPTLNAFATRRPLYNSAVAV